MLRVTVTITEKVEIERVWELEVEDDFEHQPEWVQRDAAEDTGTLLNERRTDDLELFVQVEP